MACLTTIGWLPEHLLMLCSSVSSRGSKEEGVQVAAGSLARCLASLYQPPCQLEQAWEQTLQRTLHRA